MRIVTDHPKEKNISLPVYAVVAGELAVSPERIYISGKQNSFWVMVNPAKVPEFKIVRVEAPVPGIQTEILPVKTSGGYAFGPGTFQNPCDGFHFWSTHPGGGNFLFADASVHFVSYSIANNLTKLATIGGDDGPVDY